MTHLHQSSWSPNHFITAFLPPPSVLPHSNFFRLTTRVCSTRRHRHTTPKRVRMSGEPLSKPVTTTTMPSTSTVLYFCYGSNMLRSKISSRGSSSTPPISFTDVFKARLPDWQLCFDLGGAPPQEPSMGSIQPEEGDEVHGIAYRMGSARCWEKLLQSEGVTDPNGAGAYDSYHVIPVTVECFVDGKYVEMSAMTLLGNPRYRVEKWMQPHTRPSRRYMNILIDGATQECLPKDYLQRLKDIPVARQWKPSPLLYIMIISIPLVFLSRRRVGGRILTYPLTSIGMLLYALHENMVGHSEGWSFSRGTGMIMIKIAMFLLYSLYAVPSVLVAVSTPMGRHVIQAVVKKRGLLGLKKE